MKNKRNIIIVIISVVILIAILWISGIIPRQIGKNSAINYVQKNYPDKNLNYLRMDFSSAHGDYFAMFEDENGKTYGFQLLGKYLPINIWSDPLKSEMASQDIVEYKSQNENLQKRINELEEILNSSTHNNFRVADILHVKELNGAYYIVLRTTKDDNGVQLWKYTENPFASLLDEGIDINIETRSPYLYYTVSKKTDKDGYIKEVVKLDENENKTMIYAGKSIEISASPDGEYFIIIENPYYSNRTEGIRNLIILDTNDMIIFDEAIKSSMDTDIVPYGWNGEEFWALFTIMAGKPEILILNAETLMYEVIENKANSREFDINMKNGWICYSDFPVFFDIDTYNDFKESKKDVNLYLYNIYSEEEIHVDTSIAKEFTPKWIDEYTFVYTDPDSDNRLKYTIEP